MVGLHVSVVGGGNVDAEITYHLQVAARAFYSNKGTLLDKNVSANLKPELFDATVTSIACFAAGHCSIRQHNLHILDVEIRRLVRSVVPRPSGFVGQGWPMKFYMCGTLACRKFSDTHHKSKGQTALCHHWTLATTGEPPPNRWAKRGIGMADSRICEVAVVRQRAICCSAPQ